MEKRRESSFELARLVAQYMIVVYHIILFLFWKFSDSPDVFLRAFYIPLHIGVPVFVILSGYFHIKFSLKGIARLVVFLLIYEVGLRYIGDLFPHNQTYISEELSVGSNVSVWKQIFFVSGTSFWFVRTYIMLFLIAPIINKYLENITYKSRICLIVFFTWMCCYIPLLNLDPSLEDGKNLPTFIFYYIIGDTVCRYKNKWKSWSQTKLITTYLIINIGISVLYYMLRTNGFIGMSDNVYRLVFYYYSPVLILNAILFVIIFGKKTFYNETINKLSRSSLAIYIIHGSYMVLFMFARPVSLWIQNNVDNEFIVLLLVLGLGLVITVGCIIVDQVLTPITTLLTKWLTKILEIFLGNLTKEYK